MKIVMKRIKPASIIRIVFFNFRLILNVFLIRNYSFNECSNQDNKRIYIYSLSLNDFEYEVLIECGQ